jgi:hypothetical protein
MKHTPGPWAVHSTTWEEGGNLVQPIIAESDKMAGQRLIALVRLSAPRLKDGAANACLIAAAPDLLEAGEKLLKQVDAYLDYVSSGDPDKEMEEAADDLKAAIAKARGKQ